MFTAEELFYLSNHPKAVADKLNTALTNATDAGNAVKIGTLANLTTTDKTSLVLAINELVTALATANAAIDALEARVTALEGA